MQRGNFFVVVLVSAILTTAAVSPSAVAQTVPDFSGLWAHPYLPGFEPPAAGAGPVLNKSRLRSGQSNWNRLIGDYGNPILKPKAAEVVKKHGEISQTGTVYPTPSNQCWPGGVPFVFCDFLVQMVQTQDQVAILYRHGNEVRRVRINQRHPAKVTPSWYGDSVGRYEGDTLVIDTVGIKPGPFAMLDMFGTPFSDKLHVTERYRLLDVADAKDALTRNDKENFRAGGGGETFAEGAGNVLQLHFTVEDEDVFTMPWSATITYRRAVGEWTELICLENRNEYYGDKQSEVPVAEKPDF